MKTIKTCLLAVALVACDRTSVKPEQQILGKWEEFYIGNGEYRPPIANPLASWHFLPDSVLLEYEYATKKTTERKYWIDTLLNIGTPGGYKSFYTAKFYADTMELRHENRTAIFYVSKWKRIN